MFFSRKIHAVFSLFYFLLIHLSHKASQCTLTHIGLVDFFQISICCQKTTTTKKPWLLGHSKSTGKHLSDSKDMLNIHSLTLFFCRAPVLTFSSCRSNLPHSTATVSLTQHTQISRVSEEWIHFQGRTLSKLFLPTSEANSFILEQNPFRRGLAVKVQKCISSFYCL